MHSSNSVLVVSDLHIGCGALDDFDSGIEQHFVEFLAAQGAPHANLQLVINGDLLDFVQAPPFQGDELESLSSEGFPLCFTESQSFEKLIAILAAHQPTIQGLRKFLDAGDGHSIVILPGNHDADFFWPSVRDRFLGEITGEGPGRRSRIRFHFNRVYRPEACPSLWIEHGHQYDMLNRFYLGETEFWSEANAPIWKTGAGSPRLIECVGTRFLIRYLNALDARYPFVDNVKPFSRFVRIFAASALTGSGSVKVALSMAALLRYLALSVYSGQAGDLLAWEGDPDAGPQALLVQAVKHLTNDQRTQLAAGIRSAGYPLDSRPLDMILEDKDDSPPLVAFLSDHPDLVSVLDYDETADDDLLALDADDDTLGLLRGFNANETEDLRRAADDVLRTHTDVHSVVMGHTHEPVNTPAAHYFNTGSWTRYYRFDKKEKTQPWKVLRTSSYENFPYELNYVEIDCASDVSVEMKNYCRKP